MTQRERKILLDRSLLPPVFKLLGVLLLSLSAMFLASALRGGHWGRHIGLSLAFSGAGVLLLAVGRVILVLEDIRAATLLSSGDGERPRVPRRRRLH